MARQVICDRCGKVCALYGVNAYKPLKISRKSVYYKSEYETEDGREITHFLCPDCLNSFKKWIKSGRVTNGTDNP